MRSSEGNKTQTQVMQMIRTYIIKLLLMDQGQRTYLEAELSHAAHPPPHPEQVWYRDLCTKLQLHFVFHQSGFSDRAFLI